MVILMWNGSIVVDISIVSDDIEEDNNCHVVDVDQGVIKISVKILILISPFLGQTWIFLNFFDKTASFNIYLEILSIFRTRKNC